MEGWEKRLDKKFNRKYKKWDIKKQKHDDKESYSGYVQTEIKELKQFIKKEFQVR